MNTYQNTWTPNTPGIFLDLPAETYHAAPGLSHSMMKNIEPPARLPHYLKTPREPSIEMILGTLVHATILEPDKPLPLIALKPDGMTFSSNEGKAWRDKQDPKAMIIPFKKWQEYEGCVKALSEHEEVIKILSDGKSEVSCFSPIPGTDNLLHKARMDFVPVGNILADIKTVADEGAEAEEFGKKVVNDRFYTQAPHYIDVWNALMGTTERKEYFAFIVVEKKPPYLIAIHYLDEEMLADGRERNAENTAAYVEGMKTGKWPGYPAQAQKIKFPGWYINQRRFKNRQ